jgi:hypothetical protein
MQFNAVGWCFREKPVCYARFDHVFSVISEKLMELFVPIHIHECDAA